MLSSVTHMLHDVMNRTPMVPSETAGFALTLAYNCALVGGELVALPIVSEEGLMPALLSFSVSGMLHASLLQCQAHGLVLVAVNSYAVRTISCSDVLMVW